MTMRLPTSTQSTIDTVRNEFDRVIDRVMGPAMALSMGLMDNLGSRCHPALNVIEEDDALIVEAELPGVAAYNLDITITDGMLTIAGRRNVDTFDGNDETTVLRRERQAVRFERSIRLPVAVHNEDMDAVLEDGVLTITLPKAVHACTRRIEVRN